MVREILNIAPEDITKLKKLSMDDEQVTNKKEKNLVVTTMEVIAGYVWRSRYRAMKLSPDKTTALGISVGIRNTMEPLLPEGYYRNAFVHVYVALTAKELRETPMYRVVSLIKEAKRAAVGNGYVWEQLREMERTMKLKLASEEEIHGGVFMMVTDWCHLGQDHNAWGGLVNIISLVLMAKSFLCILLPASKTISGMSGSVGVHLSLPKDAMAQFKEEMDALNL